MKQPSDKYTLQKVVWTEEDFDVMGWHDCRIHAISFGDNFELLFDIDYIFQWVMEEDPFNFWVSPCTLVFENAYDIQFDIEQLTGGMNIYDIAKELPTIPKNAEYINRELQFVWSIQLHEGVIQFKSIGYKQYVRRWPVSRTGQSFGLAERGGISFEKTMLSQ
jgi:hypothetical protein